METIAFRMILNPGQAAEYRRRHDDLWPELRSLLLSAGVEDYSIWLDEETHHLFAHLVRRTPHGMDVLPREAVVRRWWDFMADIMQVEADNTPVQVALQPMFRITAGS